MKVKALLYCTKAKPMLRIGKEPMKNQNRSRTYNANEYEYFTQYIKEEMYEANGKIVAECEVETEEIEDKVSYFDSWFNEGHHTKTLSNKELEKRSCLSYQDLIKYLGDGEPNEVIGYALHISNLKIFDKPKKLDDFTTRTPVDYDSIVCDSCTDLNRNCKKCRYYYDYQQVIKAPQNMMKVCEWDVEDKVLISINPEWLCKILNGEKTIEVRRKVLKGMVD